MGSLKVLLMGVVAFLGAITQVMATDCTIPVKSVIINGIKGESYSTINIELIAKLLNKKGFDFSPSSVGRTYTGLFKATDLSHSQGLTIKIYESAHSDRGGYLWSKELYDVQKHVLVYDVVRKSPYGPDYDAEDVIYEIESTSNRVKLSKYKRTPIEKTVNWGIKKLNCMDVQKRRAHF